MYHVKDSNGNRIFLGEAPVYATCPECGAEHEFNELWDMLIDGDDFDLYSDAWCEKCSQKKARRQETTAHGLHLLAPNEQEG